MCLMVTFVYTNIRMRSILLLLSSLFCVLLQANVWAQPDKMITNRDNYFWQFGVAWTTTDDDGKELNPAPFDQLHGLPFPSRLYVDRYIYNGWSAEIDSKPAALLWNASLLMSVELTKGKHTVEFIYADPVFEY